MKFAISAALLAFAGVVSAASLDVRQSCPQASRFGNVIVTPTVVSPGDTISITVDLTCAVKYFGIVAQFIDYTIEVPAPSNNGHQPSIVLARRAIPTGALSDSFSVQIPHAYYFSGSPYNIAVTNIYPISGTDGSSVVVKGGVLQPITINA